MRRRRLLAAAALPAAPAIARAQAFDHSLRIIAPNTPGGTSDILARPVAGPLGRARGNIGADFAAKSPPDGHALLLLLYVSVLATSPGLFARLPFDVERDSMPVQLVIYAPCILEVSNALPVQDAAGLVAYARANPGKLNAANSGTGTLTHIVALSLAAAWGTEMTSVPYRGGAPALLAVASNEVHLTMAGATRSPPFVVNGQMRGIAVSGPRRSVSVPNLPTCRELGWPQPDAVTWQGLLVQGSTPPAVIARLEREVRLVLEDPAIEARAAELGGEVRADGSAAFRSWLRAETENLGRIIRGNNVRME